jgi:AcrR family transcriptional regulator
VASSSSKTKILDCAERIVVRDGVAHLTMDAVAAEAGMSKGGVLYNFPSKDDLIRGMVLRLMQEFEAEMARLVAADPEPKGRLLRAYLGGTFPPDESAYRHQCQVAGALLAAILTNQALLDPLRERFREAQEQLLQDGLDPAHVHLVRLAADGLWMGDLLGMPGPGPQTRREVIQHLYEFTRI